MNKLVAVKKAGDFANTPALFDQFIKADTFKDDIRPYLSNLAAANPEIQPLQFIEFIQACALTGADPRRKEVYLIPYKKCVKGKDLTGRWTEDWITVASTVFDYKFFISRAQSMGDFEGYSTKVEKDLYFNPFTGNEILTLRSDCTVKRKGREPFTYRAWLPEFVKLDKNGRPTDAWASKPHMMTEKCSVANAFRLAWPESLSGVYCMEEMGNNEHEIAVVDIENVHKSVTKPVDVNKPKVETVVEKPASTLNATPPKSMPPQAREDVKESIQANNALIDVQNTEPEPIDASYEEIPDGPLDNVPEEAPPQPVAQPAQIINHAPGAQQQSNPAIPASNRTKAILYSGMQYMAQQKRLDLNEAIKKVTASNVTEELATKIVQQIRAGNLEWFGQ